MRRGTFTLAFAGTVLHLVCLPSSRAEAPKLGLGSLEKTVLAELAATHTPGAAVAVIQGDRVVLARGFGVADVETRAPVTPDMLFRIGSTTKMFTAAALVQLAHQGKVKFDDPVGTYVKGLTPKVARLTSHQLLTHTAGLKSGAPWYGSHDDSALGVMVRSWQEEYLIAEPGKVYSYSNPGYWLAGLVVEECGGRPYADQLNESLFKPLGMRRTTLRPTTAMTYPMAQGHALAAGEPAVIRPAADNAATWPAGSIFTSVSDFARFVIAFMNGGKIDGRQVLEPEVIAKMASPHVQIPGSEAHYGYGLRLRTYRGVELVEHDGARLGYGSVVRMAPRFRFAVIVLANKSAQRLERTAERAMEICLPLQPRPQKPTSNR
jgi:CubicO group peptidase (beta-lactamase class C family)